MNTDFRLSVGLFTHPKFVKLTRRLGDTGGLSFLRLLSFTAQNHPNGDLAGMDAEEIAIAGQYTGDAETFVATLLELRLLDETEDGDAYCVHDWHDHNPWAAGAPARTENARRAANARWGNANGSGSAPVSDAPSSAPQSLSPESQSSPHAPAMRRASPRNAPLLTSPNQPILTEPTAALPAEGIAGASEAASEPSLGQAAGGGGCMPDGWEGAEKLPPDVLMARFQQDFPERAGELVSALASADGPVRSQPAFLKPVILRILRGQQPAPITAPASGSSPPAADSRPIPERYGRGDGTVGVTVRQVEIDGWQKRCLSEVPHEAWPDLEKRARESLQLSHVMVDTLCKRMRKLWDADQAKVGAAKL